VPPPENYLVRNYVDGTTIPFNGSVNYTCVHGFFFEDNMHMIAFSLTCLTNATVPVPSGWKKCVDPTGSSEMLLFLSLANVNIYLFFYSERFCPDPHVPPFNGGKYDWNLVLKGGRTAFETEITYECDVGRRFAHYTINETIYYDRKTLYCEWNRTWSPEEPVSIWSDLKEQISFIFLSSWMSVNGYNVLIHLSQMVTESSYFGMVLLPMNSTVMPHTHVKSMDSGLKRTGT
jgi:hypothetical protein